MPAQTSRIRPRHDIPSPVVERAGDLSAGDFPKAPADSIPHSNAFSPRIPRADLDVPFLHPPTNSPHLLAAGPPVARYSDTAIGVTGKGTPIKASVYEDEHAVRTRKTRILLVGDGTLAGRNAIGKAVGWFYHDDEAKGLREKFIVSTVSNPYPDGRREGDAQFPPQGTFYVNDGDPEVAYLWRWIGMHGPDLVVEVRAAKAFAISAEKSKFDALECLRKQARSDATFPQHSLVAQLMKTPPGEVGIVPAVAVGVGEGEDLMPPLLAMLQKAKFVGPSPAREELLKRLDRTPLEVAEQLAGVYGRDLGSVVYIPAVAAIGQVRLAGLTEDEKRLAMVRQLAGPYLSGDKPSKLSGDVAYAGHLIFAELAQVSEDDERERCLALAKAAADALLKDDGSPDLKKMSSSQMSDAVFMSAPILSRVGRLTGDAKYFDAATAHVANMAKMDLRDDSLWRHSPLDEAAWGRGNGFAALGLAMVLDDLPQDHPRRDQMLGLFRRHIYALAEHQDYTGAWHQVIDHEESYRELSCTCMITFAMSRGVRSGWLGAAKFQPIIDRAWHAIRTRVAADGTLVDVCTGTGKQKNLRAYLDRPAILGRDARGGAMALLVATELAAPATTQRAFKGSEEHKGNTE